MLLSAGVKLGKTCVDIVEPTPMINAIEVGAAPQIADPTSKINSATRKTHFGLKTL